MSSQFGSQRYMLFPYNVIAAQISPITSVGTRFVDGLPCLRALRQTLSTPQEPSGSNTAATNRPHGARRRWLSRRATMLSSE